MLTVNFNKLSLASGDSVLDLGCGEGRHSIGLAFERADVFVIGVDLSMEALTTAAGRIEQSLNKGSRYCRLINSNGVSLPFADNSLDHIICSEVLEHIVDYHIFLIEMERILKPGGSLTISVPRAWPERLCWWLSEDYHQVEGGHVHIFPAKHLRKQIQKNNFYYIEGHGAHALHVPYWWLRCLFWKQGDTFFITRIYHKLLLWDLFKRPLLTRILDKLLNPVMGKSVVMYFKKNDE